MYLGQWYVSLDPISQRGFTEVHIMQNAIVHNCSGGGTNSSAVMAAVVIAVARAPYQRKNILTSRAVFGNHLPRLGVLHGNRDRSGGVRGGREEYAIIVSFFLKYLWLFFL